MDLVSWRKLRERGARVARKIRNGVLILLAVAIVAFAAWMLWPRSIGGAVELEGREIAASIITSGWEEVRDEGNFYNRPTMDMERYVLPAGSEGARAVLELLDGYAWHPCWDTLTGETSISDIRDLSVTLYSVQNDALLEFSVYTGTGKARLNDRVVQIGYFGAGEAAALCQALADLLRAESSAA